LRVFRAFQVDTRLLDKLDDMRSTISSISEDRRIICLLHGEHYAQNRESLVSEWRQNSNHIIAAFSVGARTAKSSKDPRADDSTYHIRSLEQVIPQALIELLDEHSSKSTSTAGGDPSDSDTEQKPKKQEVSYQQLRVLIAEDNKINQKVLHRMLGRLNIKLVDIVENGRDAVEREASSPYDVILMDQQMPIMGGVPACRAIVNRKTGTHPIPYVVFVTAHVSSDFEKECRAAGSSGFLPKPFKVGDIEKCFEDIARRMVK
jgi:CheY-like chemotaxis protein